MFLYQSLEILHLWTCSENMIWMTFNQNGVGFISAEESYLVQSEQKTVMTLAELLDAGLQLPWNVLTMLSLGYFRPMGVWIDLNEQILEVQNTSLAPIDDHKLLK